MEHKKLKIKRALLSVSDKAGIVFLAKELKEFGVEIISTGGTAKLLESEGVEVTPIQKVTGNPEAFGGRMKTISFQIESALLYRRFNSEDQKDLEKLNIPTIDLVVCNLYPFAKAVKNGADEDELIENIDIGGPTMIRAAAKNYEGVACCTNPHRYQDLVTELGDNEGELSFQFRRELAREAFNLTAEYDAMIASELNDRFGSGDQILTLKGTKQVLRYGENPHQESFVFSFKNNEQAVGVATAEVLQGKALSYNNLLDADAAWKCNSDVLHSISKKGKKAVTVIKHANPCGVAVGDKLMTCLEQAWACDPVSAFGSIICFSDTVDEKIATWLTQRFVEIVIAPGFDDQALEVFSSKKNLRLLVLPVKDEKTNETVYRSLSHGLVVQKEDEELDREFQNVTDQTFSDEQIQLAHFGTTVCKYLKSNAIALVGKRESCFVIAGAGMGQPNRLDSLKMLAVPRAKELSHKLEELVLISDAFFPFADTIEEANKAGVKFLVQPGGSIRDKEVIEAANRFNMAMMLTGRRHFRH